MMITEKPRVLYLSYDGLTDPLGQSQVLPYLKGLADTYSITIVSFEKEDRFKTGRMAVEEICAACNIQWEPLPYHKTPPVLSTLFDLWRLNRKTKVLHKKHSYRIVHCRSYITSLVGLRMKRSHDVKFIFDMRGFWADERVDGGLWNLKNPLYRMIYQFFKRMEKRFLNESDHVISLTENAKSQILSWNIPTPVTVIPCCVDTELFNPARYSLAERQKLRESLGLTSGEYIVLYLGSLGTWYMVDEMLNLFSSIKEKDDKARFLIVTPDEYDFHDYKYRESLVIRSVPREKVPLYVSIAHLGIFFIKPSFSKNASSPTKMGELLSMNIPLVCNSGWGDVTLHADQLKGIKIVKPEEKRDIYQYIMDIDPAGNRAWVLENLSLSGGQWLYKKIYDCLPSP